MSASRYRIELWAPRTPEEVTRFREAWTERTGNRDDIGIVCHLCGEDLTGWAFSSQHYHVTMHGPVDRLRRWAIGTFGRTA